MDCRWINRKNLHDYCVFCGFNQRGFTCHLQRDTNERLALYKLPKYPTKKDRIKKIIFWDEHKRVKKII